ncbi:hypothetical protein [Proteus phage RP7]|nr:hypothetical protein [Proteus phage RP7]
MQESNLPKLAYETREFTRTSNSQLTGGQCRIRTYVVLSNMD